MRELDQTPRASDANRDASLFKTKFSGSAADKKAAARAADASTDQQGASTKAWYSGGGLRRRLYKKDRPDVELDAASAALAADPAAEQPQGRLMSRVVLGVSAVVVVLGIVAYVLAGPAPVMNFAADLPKPGADILQYVRGLSAWHEVSRDEIERTLKMPSADVTPEECANSELPAVQALCTAAAEAAASAKAAPSYTPYPQFAGVDDQLASLDLDCTSPHDAAACHAAANSNSYEGEMDVEPALLAAHEAPTEAGAPATIDLGPDFVSLDTLDLDCTTDPAACAKAARTNTYEGDGFTALSPEVARAFLAEEEAAVAAAVAADAASDLSSLDLDCSRAGEDAVVATACAAAAASNSYEGPQEHFLESMRLAEQAGAGDYMNTGMLSLDCSSGDALMQAECARAAASNTYDTQQAANADPADEAALAEYAANAARAYSRAPRTPGYESSAQEWDPIAAQAEAQNAPRRHRIGQHHGSSCGCSGHDHKDLEAHAAEHAMPGETFGHANPHLHMRPLSFDGPAVAPEAIDQGAPMEVNKPHLPIEQQLDSYEDALRTTGHDAPAIAAPSAAASLAEQSADANAKRVYYKNAANAPRAYYKNAQNDPANRQYYKNPANAPPGYQAFPVSTQPQPYALWLSGPVLLSMVVALASTAFIVRQLKARRTAPADAATQQTDAAVDTESLPAAPGLLAVPEPIPDHVDSPRGTAYDSPRLALKQSGAFAGMSGSFAGINPERPSSALDDSMLDSPRRNRTPVPGGRDSPIRHLDSPRRARTPGLRPSAHSMKRQAHEDRE